YIDDKEAQDIIEDAIKANEAFADTVKKLRCVQEAVWGAARRLAEKPAVPTTLQNLFETAKKTHNVILYGPPGVGKTWLVNHFAIFFLLHHNLSPETAGQYGQAVVNGDVAVCQGLRSLVRAESAAGQAEPAYWWIVANDTEWDRLF